MDHNEDLYEAALELDRLTAQIGDWVDDSMVRQRLRKRVAALVSAIAGARTPNARQRSQSLQRAEIAANVSAALLDVCRELHPHDAFLRAKGLIVRILHRIDTFDQWMH